MKYYVVDAFAEEVFSGNPAAVCIMDAWPEDELMRKIAAENNLSETAFAIPSDEPEADYCLRWFTPTKEVNICGHATLATAFVICSFYRPDLENVTFSTHSGILRVQRRGELFQLDFPAMPGDSTPVTDAMEAALGLRPIDAFRSIYLVVVLENDRQVRELAPDLEKVSRLDEKGANLIVTARGDDCDFVSRAFLPNSGIPEDPVNGSSHCVTAPYWTEKLGKKELVARMRSKRGGTLHCIWEGDRVKMAGRAVLYAEGELHLPL